MAAGQDRRVEQIIVSVPLDPYLSLKALATYSGLSVRKLRNCLRHPSHPLPHYRVVEVRDDFTEPVKRTVAARAGNRCSNPDCHALTSRPRIDSAKALNLGVAAHFTAAAEGGPRYDPRLLPEQRMSAENALWLCQNCSKLADNNPARFTEHILRVWKDRAEAEALATIGKAKKPAFHSSRRRETEIKRNLALKKKMQRDFLKRGNERGDSRHSRRPYDKFAHSEVIVHSLDDSTYPDIDIGPGMSGWFKVELYNFYHNGLEAILGIDRGIIDKHGQWAAIASDQHFDRTRYQEVKLWRLGRIPWRNIREYDLDGDEYYSGSNGFSHVATADARRQGAPRRRREAHAVQHPPRVRCGSQTDATKDHQREPRPGHDPLGRGRGRAAGP